jgi:hypothetical protein
MNRLTAISLLSILTACAAEAPQAPPVITTRIHDVVPVPAKPKPPVAAASMPSVVDPKCIGLAKYALAIANLKSIGVSLDDLGSFTQNPIALEFPMKALQQNVYAFSTSPEDTAKNIQNRCVQIGYKPYVDELSEDQRVRSRVLQMDTEPGIIKKAPKKK